MRLIREGRFGDLLSHALGRLAVSAKLRPLFCVWLSTACVALQTHAAFAYCPTSETARKGFALVGPEGRTRVDVKPSENEIVSFDLFVGGELKSTPTYYKGLYLIRVVTGNAVTTATYDFDYMKEPDLAVGYQRTYHVSITTPDGKTTVNIVDNRVSGRENLTIGDCTVDTLVLDSQIAFPNRPLQTRHTNYSPMLKTFVRETITNDGSPPFWLIYDHIEPPPR
jgi:hypothetical protein